MTAAALVEKAGVKAGLCTAGAVPDALAAMGLADLNRWYRHIWTRDAHPETELDALDVAVPAGALEVALPTVVDVILSVRGPHGAILPISAAAAADAPGVWLDASGAPTRFLALPDGTDDAGKPVRRIRLAPVPSAALTVTVKGLRRFADLSGGDSILLTRFETALYFFVLGEMYRFVGDDAARKAAFADAAEHLKNALASTDRETERDNVQTPPESIYDH